MQPERYARREARRCNARARAGNRPRRAVVRTPRGTSPRDPAAMASRKRRRSDLEATRRERSTEPSAAPRRTPLGSRDSPPPRQDHLTSTTRSEEHTSELQSLMRIPYAVFCLKQKNKTN